jgi:putrescine N-hydroxylase
VTLDVAGVGVGPFNLSLAALASGLPDVRAGFFEERPCFSWHPGLLIEGATLQVPFLADLVTLAEPSSPWSFLSFLRARGRLFPFYFAERFHIDRVEFDAYCRWVCEGLAACGDEVCGQGLHFGRRVESVAWDAARGVFVLEVTASGAGRGGAGERVWARNVVLGVGTAPQVPAVLRPLVAEPGVPVVHAAEYVGARAWLAGAARVAVVGSGQSGAEVFLDLLRRREAGREGLWWLTRSPAFAPMEYSKLGLEHFTPDYARYFHALPEAVRDALVPRQWQLYKAVDAGTLAAVHEELYRRAAAERWPDAVLTPGVEVRAGRAVASGGVELDLVHAEQGSASRLSVDAVVLATGYRERPLEGLLAPLGELVRRDASGRLRVAEDYRVVLDPSVSGGLFVQNAERHAYGVGAPDLGLGAYRSARILNAVSGKDWFVLPERTAFTSFGLA